MIIERQTPTGILYFDDKTHRFWKIKDGKKIPYLSVTGFTGILDKPGLKYWAVGLAEDYLVNLLNQGKLLTEVDIYLAGNQHEIAKAEHADIGIQIHDWTGAWLDGKNPLLPEHSSVLTGITSFLDFQSKYNFHWLAGEQITCSDTFGFAGRWDRKLKLDEPIEYEGQQIPAGLYMTDFKSSNQLDDVFAFQTGLYQVAEEEITGEKFAGRLVIRFAKESEEEQIIRYEKKNAKREKLGKKPQEMPEYKVFEPRFYLENDKDIAAALGLIRIKNRLSELAKA